MPFSSSFTLRPLLCYGTLPAEEVAVHNHWWRWMIVLVLACPALGAEGSGTLKGYRMGNELYVAVSDVADYYKLGRDKSTAFERAEFRTPTATLVLQVKRRDIELNGVNHWLSTPVIAARGRLWLAKTDVLKTIDPVLCPSRLRGQLPLRTVMLDPGHGGGEHGTRGITSRRPEKHLTLDLANRLKPLLTAAGLRVVMTRTADRTLPLAARTELARQHGADLFVSLHFNSGGSATGIETYCLPPAGVASTASSNRGGGEGQLPGNRFDNHNVWLAHCVQRTLVNATGAADRGVRRARFYVLRDVNCPAILVEAGFLSNPAEEKLVLDPSYRDRLAKAIAYGILAYRNSVDECSTPDKKPGGNSPRR